MANVGRACYTKNESLATIPNRKVSECTCACGVGSAALKAIPALLTAVKHSFNSMKQRYFERFAYRGCHTFRNRDQCQLYAKNNMREHSTDKKSS